MPPNVIPFRMHTIEEVHESLPKEVQPTKPNFRKLIEKHGLFRELCGKQFMLDTDIEQLFEIIRASPKAADLKRGVARLIAEQPSPNEMGYLVVLGDALDTEAPVFVGWGPRDNNGIDDLTNLVQYGYPGSLETLAVWAATPDEVRNVKTKLSKSRIGGKGWFARSEEVVYFLTKLRENGVQDHQYADDEEDDSHKVVELKGAI